VPLVRHAASGVVKEERVSDLHAPLRAIPFEVLAEALAIDLARFKRNERNKEWVGPCPYTKQKSTPAAFVTAMTDGSTAASA
jgi:hypothetical protein